MLDWDAIQVEIEGSSKSIRAIAKEYGTSHTTINKKIEKEKWKRYVPPVSVSTSDVEQLKPHAVILGKVALRKIEELKKELGKNYSNVDEPLIVMYAKSYERYIELELKLLNEGYLSYSPKTGAAYINPTFNCLQMTQKTLVTIANQLGFSMISRKQLGLKLGSEVSDEPSIFDFIGGISKSMSAIDV